MSNSDYFSKAAIPNQTHSVPVGSGRTVLAGNQVALVVPVPTQSTMVCAAVQPRPVY
jgi:hypothetical protein